MNNFAKTKDVISEKLGHDEIMAQDRKMEHASKLSSEAFIATSHAAKTGNSSDHEKAAKLHLEAARAHDRAGFGDTALGHYKQAGYHDNIAKGVYIPKR